MHTLTSSVPFSGIALVFAAAVTLHNIEEAVWLPGWSKTVGRLQRPVDPFEFRFAVTVLTLLALVLAVGCRIEPIAVFCRYSVSGYALAMLLNVVFPHVAATIALRKYAPGLATALLLNLPVTVWLLHRAFDQDLIDPTIFIYTGPLTVLVILVSIPVLFRTGRKLSAFL